MVAQDFQHRRIGESLFVVAEPGGCVDAGEDCRLSGSALRAAFNPQTGVGGNHDPVEDSCRFLVAKDGQRFGIVEAVERVVWATCAYSEPVDEE